MSGLAAGHLSAADRRRPSALARLAGLALLALASSLAACGGAPDRTAAETPSMQGQPMALEPDADNGSGLITTSYIDPDAIGRISRFRSGVGHDFADGRERCRSMKHYFEPRPDLDWASIEILAPATGELTELAPEWAGTRLRLRPDAAPERRIVIYHLRLEAGISVGARVVSGQRLGWHQGSETLSDIAIEVLGEPYRLESYFQLLDRSVWADFERRGIAGPGDLILSRAARDARPLHCQGDRFLGPPDPSDWIALGPIAGEAP